MIILTGKVEGSGPAAASLTLAFEQRIKSRLRVRLDDGREAGLFLERGAVLRDGDLLRSDQGLVVEVRAAAEEVSTVLIESTHLLARVCYHLGNRHVPLQISENGVSYRADHVLDDLLRTMGLEVVHALARFEPECGGAYGNKGAPHAHHGHGH